jgi:hypothetical protein
MAMGRVLPADTSHPLWKGVNGYTGTPETEAAFRAANASPAPKTSTPEEFEEAKSEVRARIGGRVSPTILPLDVKPNKPDVDTATVGNRLMDESEIGVKPAVKPTLNPASDRNALFKPSAPLPKRKKKVEEKPDSPAVNLVVDPKTGEVKDSGSYTPEVVDPKAQASERLSRAAAMRQASEAARQEISERLAPNSASLEGTQERIDAQRDAAPQRNSGTDFPRTPGRRAASSGRLVGTQVTYDHPKFGPLDIKTDEKGSLVLPHPQTFDEKGKPVALTQQQAELNMAHYEGFTKTLGGGVQQSNAEAQGATTSGSIRTGGYEYDHPTMGRINVSVNPKGDLILPHKDIDPRDGSQIKLSPQQEAVNKAHEEAFADIKSQETARNEINRKKGDFGFTIKQPEHKTKVAERTAKMQAVDGRTKQTGAGPFMGPTSRELVGSVRGHLSALESHVNGLEGIVKTPAQKLAFRTAQSALNLAKEHSDIVSSYETQPRLANSPEKRAAVQELSTSVGHLHDSVNHPELSELAGPSPVDVGEILDNHVVASSHAAARAFRAPKAGKVSATVKTAAGAAATGLKKGTTVTMDPKDSRMGAVIDLVKNKVRSGKITGPLDEWVRTLSGQASTGTRISGAHFTHLSNVARGATLANYYGQLENHVRESTLGNFSEKNGIDPTREAAENVLTDRFAGEGPTNPRGKGLESGDLVPAGGESALGELGSHLNAVYDHLTKFTGSPAPKNMGHFAKALDSLAKAHAAASRPELGGRINALPFNMDDVKEHINSITPDTVKIPAVDRGTGGRKSGQGISVGEMTRPEIFANQRSKPVADLTDRQKLANQAILNPATPDAFEVSSSGETSRLTPVPRTVNPNPMHGSVSEGVSSGPMGTAPIMQPGDRRPADVPVEKLGQQLLRGELRERMRKHLSGEPGHIDRINSIKSELSSRFSPSNRALLDADFDPDKAEAEAAKTEKTPEPPKGA